VLEGPSKQAGGDSTGGDSPGGDSPGGGSPGSGVVVRSARVDDLEAIVACMASGALVEGREDASDLAPYRAALDDAQRAPSDVLVAEADGEVVGVAQFIVFRHLQYRGRLCAELESVHVRPDRRGRGIGTLLVTSAVERARSIGCHRIQLTSNVARTAAHRFWERMGFVPSHIGYKLPLG
jgi:GNAT superfamily N-acetyltransferase